MIEKTLRYPGCVEYLKGLRECGYFSYDSIEVNGQQIRPIDLTSKLLFPMWEMKEGDKDYTVMRIKIIGEENDKEVCYTYNLLDQYQEGTISMARTTGYTCTAVANLVLEGQYTKKGISPPEFLGDHFNMIEKYLKARGVIYNVKKELDSITNIGASAISRRFIESKVIFANSLESSTKESPITFPGTGISVIPQIFILLSKLISILQTINL